MLFGGAWSLQVLWPNLDEHRDSLTGKEPALRAQGMCLLFGLGGEWSGFREFLVLPGNVQTHICIHSICIHSLCRFFEGLHTAGCTAVIILSQCFSLSIETVSQPARSAGVVLQSPISSLVPGVTMPEPKLFSKLLRAVGRDGVRLFTVILSSVYHR